MSLDRILISMLVSVTTGHCLICEHGRKLGIDSKTRFVEVALTFLKIFRVFKTAKGTYRTRPRVWYKSFDSKDY